MTTRCGRCRRRAAPRSGSSPRCSGSSGPNGCTAPLSRCRQTIEPLARELGCDIVEEPLLGEDDYWVDPDAGLARLRELAAWPGVTVLCSQGGVIPAGVEALAAGSGLREAVFSDRDTVPSRKASTWALGHRDDTLLTADYYRTPTA